EKDRKRLEHDVRHLSEKIDKGNENLALLPAHRVAGVVAKIDEWEAERERLRQELEQLAQTAEGGVEYLEDIRSAMADFETLERTIREKPAKEVRDVLSQWVEKVTLYYQPPRRMKDGRGRNVLSEIEVLFREDVLHLFGSGTNTRR